MAPPPTAGGGAERSVPRSWHMDGAARLVHATPPRSTALSGVWDLLASNGMVLAASDRGISRSLDGGWTWHRVLSHVTMHSVVRAPDGYVALGIQPRSRAVLTATSRDSRHWVVHVDRHRHEVIGEFGDQAAASGDAIVAAARLNREPDAMPLLRSTDRGRHWAPVRGMRVAFGGLQTLPDGSMVATARGRGRHCASAVYRSVDYGATWQQLPASCTDLLLYDVQFLDDQHGAAVGGQPYKYGGGQVIETTGDGGQSWTVSHHVPPARRGPPTTDGFGGVHFLTPTTGYVLVGLCVDGALGPCGGALKWTVDGGSHLATLSNPSQTGWLSIASTAPGHAVAAATGKGADVVGVTRDHGEHWRLEAPPTGFSIDELAGVAGTLIWQTPLGPFVSVDGGARWAKPRRVVVIRRRIHRLSRELAASERVGSSCDIRTYQRETWKLCQPGFGERTWVVYRRAPTAAWVAHQVPNWVGNFATLVVTGRHTAVFVHEGALWRSRDAGATWRQAWPWLPGEGRG